MKLYQQGWSALPRSLFLEPDQNLNANAKLVLLCLLGHRNDVNLLCNPSQHTIAKECSLSVRTVSDALQCLVENEYIAIDHERSKRTNAYVFLFDIPHPNAAPVADTAPIADKQQNNQSVVFNNTTTSEQPVTPCRSSNFLFDFALKDSEPEFIEFAESLLTGVANAQQVLDEYQFQLTNKKQNGTPIRNPRGYLIMLVKSAVAGTFVPSGALEIAARRTARNARKPVAVAAMPKPVKTEEVKAVPALPEQKEVVMSTETKADDKPSSVGRSHLDSLRKNLGMRPKESPTQLSDADKEAMSAALVQMASGQRGGSSFKHIATIINRGNDANPRS